MRKLPQFPLLILLIFIPLISPVWYIAKNQLWLELSVWYSLLFWLVGSMIGYLSLQLDQILDIYLVNPQSKLALAVKQYFGQRNFQYGLRVLEANKQMQARLTFRSAIFQIIWVVLAIFTFSSTAGSFGKGFVMGLGGRLLLEQWQYFLSDKSMLKQWLFWQVKREVSMQELKYYLITMTLITLFLVITVKI